MVRFHERALNGVTYPYIARRYMATVIDMMFVMIVTIVLAYALEGDSQTTLQYRLYIMVGLYCSMNRYAQANYAPLDSGLWAYE